MQAIPVLMLLQAAPPGATPVPPVPVPAVLLVVPAVLLPVPAVLLVVPPLELPPGGTTLVVPEVEVLFVPAVELELPPAPSSGVLALEQPALPANTRNPTDAMLAYTLIMIASLVS